MNKMSVAAVGLLIAASFTSTSLYAANAGDRLYSAVPADVERLSNPYQHSDKVVKVKGKKLFRKNCMICHGARGNGRGPVAGSQDPKPTSFLNVKYTSQHPDQHLYWAVREGSKGTAMPSFKGVLTDDEIWMVVAYLRHLPVKYARHVSR